MSNKLQTQSSQVSMDAEPWSQQHEPGPRTRRDDPSGAIPRTGSNSTCQPTNAVPQTQQLYTGTERPLESHYKTSMPDCTNLTREQFIKKYFHKLPKDLKVGYYDVMVLYSDDDRHEADKFRKHLENDIFLEEPGKVKAVLYNGPEFEGASSSLLQHLEAGFSRSTFTFMFLTKKFVECDWCNLSSETCLIEAIYNKEKKWCVVPVYTVQRNKADFRIPMGLNSLKGINYYNPDEFYRKGVRRLIGDKIIKREEKEKMHEQKCYDFLMKKNREDDELEHRKQVQHQQFLRSQSELHTRRNHMLYTSGSQQPKTAGNESQPLKFPTEYMSRAPSEGDDVCSSSMEKPEWYPKLDIEYTPPQSNMPSYDSNLSKSTKMPSEPSQSTSSSMDHSNVTADFVSYPHEIQRQEVHYHYYYGNHQEKTESVPTAFNINAENVVIGENAQIIADGRKVDLEFLEAQNYEDRLSRPVDQIVDASRSNGIRGSNQTSSTCFMDNGFPTGQTSSTSSPSGFLCQTNAVEHSENETNIKGVSENITQSVKEDVKDCQSAAQVDSKGEVKESSQCNYRNIKDLCNNPSTRTMTDYDHLKEGKAQNITDTPNIPSGDGKAYSSNIPRRPIKPFEQRQPKVVAAVKPNNFAEKTNVGPTAAADDDTYVKKPVTKLSNIDNIHDIDDETNLKTFNISPSQQSTTSESEETEVLKPVCNRRKPVGKESVSSLETDGCASSSPDETTLTKDNKNIQAADDCLQMGYTEEQIQEALTLLNQTTKNRHHYNINELLDALDGKTTSEVHRRNGDSVEDQENWDIIKRDEQSGECLEMESPPMLTKETVSKPVAIKKSSTDPELNTTKPRHKKDGCKMS